MGGLGIQRHEAKYGTGSRLQALSLVRRCVINVNEGAAQRPNSAECTTKAPPGYSNALKLELRSVFALCGRRDASYWRAATRASVGAKCTPTLRPGSMGASKASLNTNNSPKGVSTRLSMRLPR